MTSVATNRYSAGEMIDESMARVIPEGDRPYRPPLGVEEALGEFRRHRGCRYAEDAVDACVALSADGEISLAASDPWWP